MFLHSGLGLGSISGHNWLSQEKTARFGGGACTFKERLRWYIQCMNSMYEY